MIINQYSGLLTWTPIEGILSSGNISIKVADGDTEDALYDIHMYSIVYETIDQFGNITTASGLVSYPDKV